MTISRHSAAPEPIALPGLPRLVLRVGFAGGKKLPSEPSEISNALGLVFATLARRLAEIAPGTPIKSASPAPHISRFYSQDCPLLRLITGLCEGGDSIAARALDTLNTHPELHPHITTEFAAVIPFDLPTYRSSRPPEFLADFDRQAARCAYVLALDGIYEKPNPDTPLAKTRRARAYRAQSTLLLRQADIMIAAADPDGEDRAGGTMETVRAALGFDLPVVFIHAGTGKVSVIEPGDDPASALTALAAGEDDWASTLDGWVTLIVADPDTDGVQDAASAPSVGEESVASHGDKVLTEFLCSADMPPQELGKNGKWQRKACRGERLWTAFEGWFRSGDGPKPDPSLHPYSSWRARSTELNYHYSGLYRGAFLMNYTLAAIAVLLAALSLVLLQRVRPDSGVMHTPAIEEFHNVVGGALAAGPAPTAQHGGELPPWLLRTLLFLGVLKLWCVGRIFCNTHRANHGDWNDRAVDYRYLAERLRTMLYLPRIGSFQPPTAAPPQYASRVVRQSAVDWLLDAIVRSVSPASLTIAGRESYSFPEGSYDVLLLKPEPLAALTDVRDRWIKEQSAYHDRNARTMGRIHTWAENWGRVLNISVIGFVLVDLTILVADLAGMLPTANPHVLHGLTPWLVFLAAVLPAAVASLNGVRFQSECLRLAERSAVMRAIISGRPPKPQTAPRSSPWRRLVDAIWHRPAAFVRTLFPFLTKPRPVAALDPAGSKVAATERILGRIATATADPASDPASWTPEVLRVAESVAHVFVQEVAEWSVLYAKEVPEP